MKVATILALPALAIAAATPQIEERDSVALPLDCVLRITNVATCLPAGRTPELFDVLAVAFRIVTCPIVIVNEVRSCLNLLPL